MGGSTKVSGKMDINMEMDNGCSPMDQSGRGHSRMGKRTELVFKRMLMDRRNSKYGKMESKLLKRKV